MKGGKPQPREWNDVSKGRSWVDGQDVLLDLQRCR